MDLQQALHPDSLSFLNYRKGQFPVTEKHTQEIITFPVDQHLSVEELDYVINIVKELSKIFSNVIISSTHKTKAEGFEGDDFLNLVLAGDSKLDFDSLNKELKTIENATGRKRDVPKFSARTLDIDIVLLIDKDEIVFESDEIKKYLFVSEPLKELI